MDYRDRAKDKRWWKSIDENTMTAEVSDWVTLELPDGTCPKEVNIEYQVCDSCEGRGAYVNPNIDRDGITRDEMHELGEEFEQLYFSGGCDITCEECQGNRIVPTPTDDDVIEALASYFQDSYVSALEQEAERRMGA